MNTTTTHQTYGGGAVSAPPTATPLNPTKATVRVHSRLSIIADLIRQWGGFVPTHREMLDRLRKLGLKTSKGTVGNDYLSLGIGKAKRCRRT